MSWSKGAIALLLAVSFLTASPAALLGAPPASIRTAVVLVVKRNPETQERVAIGTAFHIGDGWFRTAAHVVTITLPRRFEGKKLDQWGLFEADEFGNPRRFIGPFEVTCVDSRWKGKDDDLVFPHDSALIRQLSGTLPFSALQTSDRRPAVGEVVSVWGFPEGTVLFESRSKTVESSRDWVVVLNERGQPTIGGHSGSPVVDSRELVVGILSGGIRGVAAPQRAVPIWDAEEGCPRPRQ